MTSGRFSLPRCLRRGAICTALALAALGPPDNASSHAICDIDWEPEFASKPLERRFVFESFAVAADGGLSYEVSLAPCGKRRCPLEVRLVAGNDLHDVKELDVCSVAETPRKSVPKHWAGVGDPMQPDDGLAVWNTGHEYFGLGLIARPVELRPDRRGLLVHLNAGWEHPWNRHYLLVASDRELLLATAFDTAAIPAFATIDLADIDGDGFPEMLYFFASDNGEILDDFNGEILNAVNAAVYRWNGETRQIEQLSVAQAGVPVYAVVAGPYDTPAEAFEHRQGALRSCLGRYYVLRTDPFPGLAPGKFMAAAFTWREALARSERRSCVPAGELIVTRLTAFPAPRQ